jgi:phage tail sheath protein FI
VIRRLITAGLALATVVAGVTVPGGAATPAPSPPGVYQNEIPGSATQPGAPTGVPLLVGSGTINAGGATLVVGSVAQFTNAVSAPSPMLLAGVQQFFAQDGATATVMTVPTETPAAIAGALTGAPAVSGWDLLVVPALGTLGPPDWLTVATAMTSTAARSNAIALLDPPAATVATLASSGPQALTALAQQLQQASGPNAAAAVLLSSGLTSGATAAPGAPTMAGLVATTDAKSGVWQAPGGLDEPVAGGLQPAWLVTDAAYGELQSAGIDAWRVVPGYGTVLLAGETLDSEQISVRRTMTWLTESINQMLQPFVFQPNNPATWNAVTTSLSSFLTTVWQSGGLKGTTASSAFQVAVGVPSTMTAQDVVDNVMNVSVQVALVDPGELMPLTFQQQMASSS